MQKMWAALFSILLVTMLVACGEAPSSTGGPVALWPQLSRLSINGR